MSDRIKSTFPTADEMVRSVIKPDLEFRVAACSVAVEEKTKLIIEIGFVAVALIVDARPRHRSLFHTCPNHAL